MLGTVNALEATRRAGAARFVLASSGGAVYGEQQVFPAPEDHPRRPVSPYGVSKLCAEEYANCFARMHGLSCLSLRYANVYGPGQDGLSEAGVVAIFCERLITAREAVINGDGLQTRDYVHVQDVARVNRLALEHAYSGTLNVGTGREASVVEIARSLEAALGKSGAFRHGPAAPGEQRRSSLDCSAAQQALGWVATLGLAEDLAATARWFAARGSSSS